MTRDRTLRLLKEWGSYLDGKIQRRMKKKKRRIKKLLSLYLYHYSWVTTVPWWTLQSRQQGLVVEVCKMDPASALVPLGADMSHFLVENGFSAM